MVANLEDGDARPSAPESEDLLATFRDALGSHPAGAWLYVYQISPRPRHAPGKPAYVKRYDAAEILPDLEDRLAEDCGGGLYRLVMKNRQTGGMMGAGEIQISEVYPNRHAGEPREEDAPRGRSEVAALAEELRAMRREIAALHARPPSAPDQPTWREFLEVVKESRGPSNPAELMTMLREARAEGYREGQGRPPGDDEETIPRWLQSLLEYGPAIVARMMPAAPASMRGRGPASATMQGRASREARIAAPTPPPNHGGDEPAADLARVEPVQDSAGRGPVPPNLTLAPEEEDAGPTAEEIVRQIDDAILSDPDSAEFWADYVFRFAPDDMLEMMTPGNIELLRVKIRGRADFPGFNHESASGWLRVFLDRYELIRMKAEAAAGA